MATAGPNYAGTGANDAAVGVTAWSTPGNITASDDSKATTASSNAQTNYLKATNFGFAIPTDATIDGIEVSIERVKVGSGETSSCVDTVVSLVIEGTVSGSNLADTVTQWPTTDGVKTYGGASNLWGLTPTPSQLNASTSGAVLSATTALLTAARVDAITMTVYYTPVPSLFPPNTFAKQAVRRASSY